MSAPSDPVSPPPAPAPTFVPPPEDPRYVQNAALASFIIPLIAFLLGVLTSTTQGARIALAVEILVAVMVLIGACAGLAGLLAVRKFGAKGLLVPSVVGLGIGGVVMVWTVFRIHALWLAVQ